MFGYHVEPFDFAQDKLRETSLAISKFQDIGNKSEIRRRLRGSG